MKYFKNKDVELFLNKNVPIENKYIIATFYFDADGTNIDILDCIFEKSVHRYIDSKDIDDIVDCLNEYCEELDDKIYLFGESEYVLMSMSQFYKDNKYKKHRKNKIYYDYLKEINSYMNNDDWNLSKKEFENLHDWFYNTIINNKISKYEKYYIMYYGNVY